MNIERKELHELRNQLAISIGMIELAQKMIQKDGANADLTKLNQRLEKSMTAQRTINDFFENLRRSDDSQTPTGT